ncbi:C40 family peptidase [Algoriphagus halophilus]|uniref:NlpC/P60 family protein n=1 Tax=Algoriphagus halophilus TaxID=226505 RepID=A0A1N6FRT5_9BACT|nr:C40 family peptidase [Algoriphagus halophilus]SIN97953.1 NlpC/P60 family protein [Algoriphagus halophilus]
MIKQRFSTFFYLIPILAFLAFSCASKKKVASDPFDVVISTARSYTGTPYKYGGTTRAGMDCSALVYHAFYSVGVTMPRVSADQSQVGKKINQRDLQRGDLLFFATGRRKNRVTHAGIVTEVSKNDVRFIHSSTSLGVSEDYLSNRYWSKVFLFARRVME